MAISSNHLRYFRSLELLALWSNGSYKELVFYWRRSPSSLSFMITGFVRTCKSLGPVFSLALKVTTLHCVRGQLASCRRPFCLRSVSSSFDLIAENRPSGKLVFFPKASNLRIAGSLRAKRQLSSTYHSQVAKAKRVFKPAVHPRSRYSEASSTDLLFQSGHLVLHIRRLNIHHPWMTSSVSISI